MNGLLQKMFGQQVSQFMGDEPPEGPVGADDVGVAFEGMGPGNEVPEGMLEPEEPEMSEIREALVDRMVSEREASKMYQDKVRRENKEAALSVRRNRSGDGSSY